MIIGAVKACAERLIVAFWIIGLKKFLVLCFERNLSMIGTHTNMPNTAKNESWKLMSNKSNGFVINRKNAVQ